MKQRKAVVLNSGGADSTTCVGIAVNSAKYSEVATVSVLYGQKHQKELKCAQNVADHYHLNHYELDLSSVLRFSNCSLLKDSTDIIPEKVMQSRLQKTEKVKFPLMYLFGMGSCYQL